MERKIKELEEMCNVPDAILEKLQKDIAEIKVALLGNEYNPSGGLLCRTSELEARVARLNNRYERLMWTVGTAAAIISFVVSTLVFVIERLKIL